MTNSSSFNSSSPAESGAEKRVLEYLELEKHT